MSVPHLRSAAQVLGVTADELLGILEGQEPPFAAWAEFMATALGESTTEAERRALKSILWPDDSPPTVASYSTALAALRVNRPR